MWVNQFRLNLSITIRERACTCMHMENILDSSNLDHGFILSVKCVRS